MQIASDAGLAVEEDAGILSIRIEAEPDQNRLSAVGLSALERIGRDLHQRDDINVVVLTGAGSRFFCTGILNPVLRAKMAKDDVVALVRLANRAFDALEAAPQIVIAGLNGELRAGGAELALACDIRVAASSATMMFPEAAWGGFPGAGGPYRLAEIVGQGDALDLICSGRRVDAAEMLRLRLVQRVVAPEHLDAEVKALAETIAAAGPLATRGAKGIVQARLAPGRAEAANLSDRLRYSLEWSADVDEGIAAHRENRRPVFTGR